MSDYRCGLVAVIGRPNVGKSTLINAVMGRKVSIVTAKPQTTRHRILAVFTGEKAQIIFVDTPGLHRKAGKAMNRLMNRTAAHALADADAVLFVSDATRWTEEDDDVLKRLQKIGVPVVAVINKIDRLQPREKLLEAIAQMAARRDFAEIIPVSALRQDNLDDLMAALPKYLPESPPLFPEDMHTDRSREFHAAEVIREKLTLMLHQELPYGLTVQVERYLEDGVRLLGERIRQPDQHEVAGVEDPRQRAGTCPAGRVEAEPCTRPPDPELGLPRRHVLHDRPDHGTGFQNQVTPRGVHVVSG